MMKILITGGAGYIGSVLVPLLLQDGHTVTVVDTFMYGQTSLLDCCWSDRLTIYRSDARDAALMKDIIASQDVIIPLACLTGAPACDKDPTGARTINYDAVKLLANMKSQSQMMIFPCTNSGYGIGQADLQCDETSPMRPVSLYGRLKVDIESVLLERGDCVTFRFATLFGISPRMRLDLLVNDFTYRAVTERAIVLFEPHFKRNYLHVRDAADAFRHAIARYDGLKGRAYNVGLSDANLSKAELCEIIKRHVPGLTVLASDIGKDPDQRNYIVSNGRIEASGFRPRISLDQGIRELLRGYQVIRRTAFGNV